MQTVTENQSYLTTSTGYPGTTSARFAGISTSDALAPLMADGWRVAQRTVKGTRFAERVPYLGHVIRLDHPSLPSTREFRPQLVMKNGNDGTSAFVMMAGVFRAVCMNGIYAGALAASIRIRHVGNPGELSRLIRAGAEEVKSYVPKLSSQVWEWQQVNLDENQRKMLFHLGAAARWGREEAVKKISRAEYAAQIYHRSEDVQNDLWRTFNRVQENFTRGYRTGGRHYSVRALRNIDAGIRFNRTLWNIADVAANGKLADLHLATFTQGENIHEAARDMALALAS
jgi:hypothetical protein